MASEFFEQLVTFCGLAGWILCFIGGIWILVEAFKKHFLWGLGCLFFSLVVCPIFIFLHWKETNKAFLLLVIGSILLFLVEFIVPGAPPIPV